MLGDNMGTNKHIENHLKRQKNIGIEKDVEWHCEGHHVHKNKIKSKPLPIHKNNYRFKKAFTKLPLQGTPRRF
jgi:hypothetical protein